MLRELLSNRVTADEIDSLGHLSVPYYESRALSASCRLAADLGCDLDGYAKRGIQLTLVDAYLRNLREQFLGAPLTVRGGALAVSPTRLRIYQELVNSEQDQLSATFVHEFELRTHDLSEAVAFDDLFVDRASEACIELPEHGRPRTLDINKTAHVLTLREAETLALPHTGPRKIEAEECDETGLFLREYFAGLPYSGFSDDELAMEWVFETPDGRTLGIADLESRNVLFSLPRGGQDIKTHSAIVMMGPKVFQRSHWVFNVDTGDLISVAMTVSIPLDLDGRRSVPIPPEMLETMKTQYHPTLD